MAESRVGLVDNVLKIFSRNLIGRDIERHDFERQILKTQIAPFGLPRFREGRHLLWDEEASIRGQALKNNIFKGSLEKQMGE